MRRFLKRWLRSIAAALLISLVSTGVGLAHYLYRGGSLSEVQRQVASAWTHTGKTLPERKQALLEQGRETAQRVAEQVREVARAVVPPSTSAPAPQEDNAVDAPEGDLSVMGDSPAGTRPAGPEPQDVQAYFAPCQADEPGSLDEAFKNLLRGARTSIAGAFYDFQLTSVADILIAKHREGVAVRLVSDSEYKTREAAQSCIRAGIPVVWDGRQPFMHNKFCVVDGEVVWTGSTNITENCFYRNNNNALRIASPQLAADYGTEFDEMFQQRVFGKAGTSPTPYSEVTVGDARIECYFAPDDRVQQRVVNTVNEAAKSIDVLAFAFTARPVADALASRIKAGVTVRAVFESRNAGSAASMDEYLSKAGAAVRMDTNPATMHDKVIIVDDATVITGSYNFSKAADTSNDENLLILHSPAIAHRYTQEFERLWPQ